MKNLTVRDQKHLWHPLTQHKTQPINLPIVKANGVFLYDDKGKSYIDGIASWYTCIYGHCNPFILNKVKEQIGKLDQVVFAGFTHEPAVKMSEDLMKILPKNQEKIFFSDNGSTTVDVAIKMALQYYFNRGEKRTKLIAFEDAFHGDTFGAMSVSGLSVYNGPFKDFTLEVNRVPVPTNQNVNQVSIMFEKLLEEKQIAAFIYEPLVQGAAAMKTYQGSHLQELMLKAHSYGTLCIADEVMTGFGKTGKNFASDYLQEQPDIMCFSKALTAGLIPMGLTTCSLEVYNAFLSDQIIKGFFHGHTYSANPLACTAVCASIELLQTQHMQSNITRVIQRHKAFLEEIKSDEMVKQVRQIGVIAAIDLDVDAQRYGSLRNDLFKFFMSKGVCLRPLGNTVYILAPYVITDQQLEIVYNAIKESFVFIREKYVVGVN